MIAVLSVVKSGTALSMRQCCSRVSLALNPGYMVMLADLALKFGNALADGLKLCGRHLGRYSRAPIVAPSASRGRSQQARCRTAPGPKQIAPSIRSLSSCNGTLTRWPARTRRTATRLNSQTENARDFLRDSPLTRE